MNSFTEVVRYKYAKFTGRANREEYWMFCLVVFIINIGISLLITAFSRAGNISIILVGLIALVSVIIFIPALAITIRRLHDIGKRWRYILVSLIPIAGVIWFFSMMIKESQPFENKWGPYVK